jgi:hypothetical protein
MPETRKIGRRMIMNPLDEKVITEEGIRYFLLREGYHNGETS